MSNAQTILESLDAAELRRRLDENAKEREALLVLHRAALRLERQGKPAPRPAAEGGDR